VKIFFSGVAIKGELRSSVRLVLLSGRGHKQEERRKIMLNLSKFFLKFFLGFFIILIAIIGTPIGAPMWLPALFGVGKDHSD
jgi:hypothetical protein